MEAELRMGMTTCLFMMFYSLQVPFWKRRRHKDTKRVNCLGSESLDLSPIPVTTADMAGLSPNPMLPWHTARLYMLVFPAVKCGYS